MALHNTNLDELVSEPRESLDIEVKEWLDLVDNENRAALAKEVIALANHGGGYIVIGFAEQPDGTFIAATPRPPTLDAWSQDAIQSIIAKYLDPLVQCQVTHRTAPGKSDRFPIIAVPGGHRVPIRAKAGGPDGKRLIAHRTYIRRAGPNSEEPRTAEEWDRLLERCLQNRRTELLDAMRSIMEGVLPVAGNTTPSRLDQLLAFEDQAANRWTELTAPLEEDAPPRLLQGYYDVGFAIDGTFNNASLAELRRIIQQEVRNHSGWPPFVTLSRTPYTPKAIDGAVEFWRGPEPDGSYDVPAHHDFWRISPDGFLFTRRGYNEDGGVQGKVPGTTFDITTPTWRLGEAILEASYIARAIGASEANLICHARWMGLAGRRLVSIGNPNRFIFEDRTAAQNEFEATETVALAALPDSLPEVVFSMLYSLYQLFDFFELPKRLVDEELAEMRKHQY
ncbi:AlbA family DNA-binding domain-containing protein [Microbaculum sp. FT89]|uniref:AlbA family DNA-binding domain-containing protein n=1 Tax=Microbaculum sp. FT89 TaxID=3447298 RepID=UPI003F52B7AD